MDQSAQLLKYYENQYNKYSKQSQELEKQIEFWKNVDAKVGNNNNFDDFNKENEGLEVEIKRIVEDSKIYIASQKYRDLQQTDFQRKFLSAQYILCKLWEEAKNDKDRREQTLKECQNLSNQITSFEEQTKPIVEETLSNVRRTTSNSRLAKRNIFHLQCKQLIDKMESEQKILQEKTIKLTASTESNVLSAKLLAHEANAKALTLKRAILTTQDQDELHDLCVCMASHCEEMNRLLPEIPQYDGIIQYTQQVTNRLEAERLQIIQSIQKYVSAFKALDPVFAALLGINDQVYLEYDKLSFNNDDTKYQIKDVADQATNAKQQIEEYKTRLETTKHILSKEEQNLKDEETAHGFTHDQLAQEITSLKNKLQEMNKTNSKSLESICNNIIGNIAAFVNPTKQTGVQSAISKDFMGKFNSFNNIVGDLCRNIKKQDIERKQGDLIKLRQNFADKLKDDNIQIYNPELIYVYDPNFVCIAHNEKDSVLQIIGGKPGALAEALVNPTVIQHDPLYHIILLLHICYTNISNQDIIIHITNFLSYTLSAIEKTNTTVENQAKAMDAFKMRSYPIPDYDAPDSTIIVNSFSQYIYDWLIYYPACFKGNNQGIDEIEKLINLKTTPYKDIILDMFKPIKDPKYQKNGPVYKQAQKDFSEIENGCNDFMIRAFEIYRNMNVKEVLNFICNSSQAQDDYHSKIVALRKEFQSFIYTSTINDKRAKYILIGWFHAAIDALRKYKNYELFSAIAEASNKMTDDFIASVSKKYKEKLQELEQVQAELKSAKEEYEKIKFQIASDVVPSILDFEKKIFDTRNEFLKNNKTSKVPKDMQSIELMRELAPLFKDFFASKKANITFFLPTEQISKIMAHYPKQITEEDLLEKKRK